MIYHYQSVTTINIFCFQYHVRLHRTDNLVFQMEHLNYQDTLLKTYVVFYFLLRGVHTRHYRQVELGTFYQEQTSLYVDIDRHLTHVSFD